MNEIISITEQFQTGMLWQFPEVDKQERWKAWYDSDFRTLFPVDTINSGGALHQYVEKITPPFYKLASDFYRTTVMSELPAIDASPQALSWFERMGDSFWKAVERAVEDWSIYDYGVLAVDDEGVSNIPLPSYFRAGKIYDEDELTGHILAYRYYDDQMQQARNPNIADINMPNRIRIVRYAPAMGINEVSIYQFTSGGGIGELLEGPMPANIQALITFGKAQSWYNGSESVAMGLMNRITNAAVSLNRYDNRIVVIPANSIENLKQLADTRTTAELMEAFNSKVRPLVSSDDRDGVVGPVVTDNGYADSHEFIGLLTDWMNLISGVPSSVFGQGIARNASGVARERSQDAAAAKVRDVRHDLERRLPIIASALGMPGKLTLNWAGNPFEDRVQKQTSVLELVDRGIISKEAAANALGWEYTGGNDETDSMEDSGEEE